MSALACLPLLFVAEVTALAAGAPEAAPPAQKPSAVGRLDATLVHTGIGPWGGGAHAEAGGDAANSWSAGFEYSTLAYLNLGRLTARYRHLYRIGGGQAGFDGGADIDLQIGGLLPLADRQGLVARIGARGYIYGNDRLYASLLELPAAEAGYQLLSPDWHVELLARAGLALLGKHRALDEPTDDLGGTAMYGAGVALGWRALNAELGWSAIGGDGRRLDVMGCAIVSKLALCAELARVSTGAAAPAAPSAAQPGMPNEMLNDAAGEMTSQTITIWLSVGASERK